MDASGNIYVIGTATGNFGNQLNQGTQDVYLTKYDSAGNVVFQNLLGSGGSASGYGLALDPSGGVVVTGASTADLTTTSVANGNNDSFVARYDANGNQTWIKQIQTLATNQSNAVSVDASGNITIGGSVSGGVIGAGQAAQGKGDAFLAKFDSKGKLLAESQFGTSGADSVAATATAPDGSLYVASTQNGHAVIAKYAGGDITAAPSWTQDLGDLAAGGSIGGLTVSGGKVYVSGATSNANLTAGGAASIAAPASGGIDAFVFSATDNGASVSARHRHLYRHRRHRQSGRRDRGQRRHRLCRRLDHRHLRGRSAQRAECQQRVRHGAEQRRFDQVDQAVWRRRRRLDRRGTGDRHPGLQRAGCAGPAARHHRAQPVGGPDHPDHLAGGRFLQIQGTAARTATITIDQGETFDSLVVKINAQLGGIGKASVNYTGGGENLKISVNTGNTIALKAGPQDFDALSRLGIAAGVLTAPAKG